MLIKTKLCCEGAVLSIYPWPGSPAGRHYSGSTPPAAPTVGKTWSDWHCDYGTLAHWDTGTVLLVTTVTFYIIIRLSSHCHCTGYSVTTPVT